MRRTLTVGLTAALVLGGLTGCRTKFEYAPGAHEAIAADVIRAEVHWLKPKGEKFDMGVTLENLADQPVIVLLSDIRGGRGDREGTVRHTFFNTGERTIDFAAGERKDFTLVCYMGQDVGQGAYRLEVRRVYANPKRDGKTTGDVLAESIVVEVPSHSE